MRSLRGWGDCGRRAQGSQARLGGGGPGLPGSRSTEEGASPLGGGLLLLFVLPFVQGRSLEDRDGPQPGPEGVCPASPGGLLIIEVAP